MKYISIDTETTGLDPETCQVIEFGAVVDDLSDPKPLTKLPKFQCYLSHDLYQGQPFALQMNQKILHKLAMAHEDDPIIPAYDLADYFSEFLSDCGYKKNDKIIAAGKNFASFDWPFLKASPIELHKKLDIKFHHRMLDPMSMYVTAKDDNPPPTEECKERAGLEKHVAHNAIDDALDVIRLIRFKLLCPTVQEELFKK